MLGFKQPRCPTVFCGKKKNPTRPGMAEAVETNHLIDELDSMATIKSFSFVLARMQFVEIRFSRRKHEFDIYSHRVTLEDCYICAIMNLQCDSWTVNFH